MVPVSGANNVGDAGRGLEPVRDQFGDRAARVRSVERFADLLPDLPPAINPLNSEVPAHAPCDASCRVAGLTSHGPVCNLSLDR